MGCAHPSSVAGTFSEGSRDHFPIGKCILERELRFNGTLNLMKSEAEFAPVLGE